MIKIKDINDKRIVWCMVRKKYVQFKPEEEVRQKFIEYLHKEKKYPLNLMNVERLVQHTKMLKRSDIVVYKKSGEAIMIIECKAPNVKISRKVFQQISQYNQHLRTPYLIVTNGKKHYCYKINFSNGKISFLSEIPDYQNL